MSEPQVHESVLRADRWSKVIALVVAGVVFMGASQATQDSVFPMTVGAFAGIGVRIYIPYHASVRVTDPDQEPIQAYEETGNYHHGAAGAGVVIASLGAVVLVSTGLSSTLALVGAGITGVVSFLSLRPVLPS